jgi:hypothetical protein
MGKGDRAMTTRYLTATLVAVLLAGCGGGNGTGIGPGDQTGGQPVVNPVETVVNPLGPTEIVLGQLPADFSAAYDAATDTVTLNVGTRSLVLPRAAQFETKLFRVYRLRREEPWAWALIAETASGNGRAGTFFSSPEGIAGLDFARLTETELPVDGRATYGGDYQAFVSDGILAGARINGDAALNADFESGTISGILTNRKNTNTPGSTWADVNLAPTTIAEGAFGGVATGGAALDGWTFRSTTSPGSYAGLFTGAEGQELVGGVVIPHVTIGSGTNLTEYGAFVAERTGQ